jgi:hypothetical protein
MREEAGEHLEIDSEELKFDKTIELSQELELMRESYGKRMDETQKLNLEIEHMKWKSQGASSDDLKAEFAKLQEERQSPSLAAIDPSARDSILRKIESREDELIQQQQLLTGKDSIRLFICD